MIKIGILGSTGRVGSLLIDDLANDSEARASVVHVNGKLVKNLAADTIVTNDMKVLFDSSDVIIDFSAPAATELLLTEVVENGAKKPLVIATTGFNKHQQNLLLEASKIVPILYATNMSLGVAVLNKLVALASKTLRDGWVGLDLGKPESVGRIGYMTRNDDNNVRIGDTYELFYWDMDWVSLGKQIADDFSLTFHHVPQNALLLLRDLTRGTDERIFLYKDVKQIWY